MKHPNLSQQEWEWFNYLGGKPQHTPQESQYYAQLLTKLHQIPAMTATVPQQQVFQPHGISRSKVKKKGKQQQNSGWAWETYAAIFVVILICLRIIYKAFTG